jgi:hypothetical protein
MEEPEMRNAMAANVALFHKRDDLASRPLACLNIRSQLREFTAYR